MIYKILLAGALLNQLLFSWELKSVEQRLDRLRSDVPIRGVDPRRHISPLLLTVI